MSLIDILSLMEEKGKYKFVKANLLDFFGIHKIDAVFFIFSSEFYLFNKRFEFSILVKNQTFLLPVFVPL